MTLINQPSGAAIPSDQQKPDETQRKVGLKELDKEGFLRIFMAQMKMQSPLKPFDSSAMLQQMAQMTSLAASDELKKTIQGLNMSINKSQVMQTSQMIGKKVQIPTEKQIAPLIKGEGLSGSVVVPQNVTSLIITIKDSNGNVVKTIDKGASSNGLVDFEWDGKDAAEKEMDPGMYKISAATVINGKKEDLICAGTFKVASVSLDMANGSVFLNVDGLGGVKMEDILKIL